MAISTQFNLSNFWRDISVLDLRMQGFEVDQVNFAQWNTVSRGGAGFRIRMIVDIPYPCLKFKTFLIQVCKNKQTNRKLCVCVKVDTRPQH